MLLTEYRLPLRGHAGHRADSGIRISSGRIRWLVEWRRGDVLPHQLENIVPQQAGQGGKVLVPPGVPCLVVRRVAAVPAPNDP